LTQRTKRQSHELNALANENAAECARVFRIPIEDQVSLVAKEAIFQVGEIARYLRHPPAVGMGCGARDLHSTWPA
jgi:hypothetical protein